METRHRLTRNLERYLPIGLVAALLLLLYAPLVNYWYDGWLNKSISIEHEYFSHGLIGLPFAAYLVWLNRKEWSQLPDQSHWSGIAILIVGILCYLSNLTDLLNLSLPLVLIGLCLWLKGIPGLSLQGFALVLIFFATPNQIPYLIAPYTLPLQSFIASTAGFILLQFGMNVRVDHIYLFVNDRIVEVAPYCAGLKMLFTSFYVGLMLLYWTGNWTSRSKTILFFTGIVAVSVSANIIRNTLLTFFHGTGREAAFDWLHEGWGGDVYSALMLGFLMVLLKWIERLFSSKPELEQTT